MALNTNQSNSQSINIDLVFYKQLLGIQNTWAAMEKIFFLNSQSNENSCIICINHHIDTNIQIQSCTNEDTRVNEV